MPTIRDIERAFRDEPPEKADERRRRLASVLHWPGMANSVRWQAQKEGAPVATRDAVLTLVEESRAQARWGRRMFWLTVVNIALAAAFAVANIIVFIVL
jgi:hypothetical protein